MIDSVLEAVYLMDFYFSLLKKKKNSVHTELLSTPSQCDHTVSVPAEAYCLCYRIALMWVCN